MTSEELESLQPTNDILKELRHDMVLEAQDAAGSGDRIAAVVLNRIANALTRNIDRREQREAEPSVEISDVQLKLPLEPLQGLETAAAEAASKKDK